MERANRGGLTRYWVPLRVQMCWPGWVKTASLTLASSSEPNPVRSRPALTSFPKLHFLLFSKLPFTGEALAEGDVGRAGDVEEGGREE